MLKKSNNNPEPIISSRLNNGNSGSAIALFKMPPQYLTTSKSKPCGYCEDTSGKCGVSLLNHDKFLCFSISSEEAVEKINQQEEYKVFNFNSNLKYAELEAATPYKIGSYDIDFDDTQTQAFSQITLLGFKPGEKVYIALLLPKNIPMKKAKLLGMTYNKKGKDFPSTPMGYLSIPDDWNGESDIPFFERRGKSGYEKIYNNGIEYLFDKNFQGYGIYIRPNLGGHNDEDIKACRTLFYECDHISKDKQKELINNLKTIGLNTRAVEETLNSLHVYIRTEELKPEVWKILQERLIQLNDSDPSIKNPGRLMRFAGFNHTKYLKDNNQISYFQCNLISEDWNSKKYSEEELNSILPEWESEKWREEKKTKTTKENNEYNNSPHTYTPIIGNIGDIPLYEILSNKNRHLINSGAGEGGRNDTCLKLATSIISTFEGYQRRNINTVEKAIDDLLPLILEYARNCSPSMDENEAIGVFERTAKFNPTDSNPDDFYQKKIKNYLYENNRDEYIKLYGKKGKQKSSEQIAQDDAQLATENIIRQSLTSLDLEKIKQQEIILTYIHKEKLSPEDLNLEKGKISIICSAKGTGKTEGLQPYMPRYKAIHAWNTRVTLGVKLAHDLGLVYKDEIENYALAAKVSFCANSAHKFHPKVLHNDGFLLFDECDQLFAYQFESLCNKDGIRPLILATHKGHLAAALTNGSAAYMSADIAQKEIDYIKAVAPPNAKIELIINTFKPQKGKLKFSTDNKPDSLIKQLITDLDNGVPCFLLDDFKNGYRGCKSIAEFIRQKRPDLAHFIVEINGDTSELEEIKQYITNINEDSKTTMLLACSPSIISGISLTNGRFNKGVYGIVNGILTPNNGSQGFARVRGAENINVWVASTGINYEASRATTPGEVEKYYQENYTARNKILLSYEQNYNAMTQEWESPHWKLFCENSALNNLEMKRLRYWYKVKLIDDGYQLEEIKFGVDASGIEDSLKEIAGQLKLDEIYQIGRAKDLTLTELESLTDKSKSGKSLTLEERQQLTKHHLRDTFGDDLIAEMTAKPPVGEELFGLEAIAFLNHRNALENPLKRFYRNFHQEIVSVAASDLYIENRQMNLRPDLPECNQRFPKDIKWQLREHKLFEVLEFKKYLDPDKKYYPEDYQPLIEKVRKYIEPIKQTTGYNFEKANDGQVIDLLYAMNGLKVEWHQVRREGKVIRVKNIANLSWDFATKFVEYQKQKTLRLEGVTTPPTLLVNGILVGGVVTAPKPLPDKEYSDFTPETTAKTMNGNSEGVVTPEYSQLTIKFHNWVEYPTIQQEDHENYNDYHTIYSYEDGD